MQDKIAYNKYFFWDPALAGASCCTGLPFIVSCKYERREKKNTKIQLQDKLNYICLFVQNVI